MQFSKLFQTLLGNLFLYLCSSDEESSQVFIPFVSDVRVGSESHPNPPSMDLDDTIGSPTPEGIKLTPPSSPHVGASSGGGSVSSTVAHILETTPLSKERYTPLLLLKMIMLQALVKRGSQIPAATAKKFSLL